ncbi:Crp/Fnr family transcriptional regulator [Listeria booriae]|uniref:Crp/Fnr family transcriptional regulator n=2 Tax=Listeria booriae TaxID=1552123 RepID=A0A7X0XS73_9LIST|nr:Crp/Fnr family transcriptional regulator [Listeria booriae]MBC1779566.1 Crp/Fnr family transcriptional regulator [Listeria booriae]
MDISDEKEGYNMYKREIICSFASYSNVIKILKKDSQFNTYCCQERIDKGYSIRLPHNRPYCYLVDTGYTKISIISEVSQNYYYINRPGGFLTLPIVEDEFLPAIEITAITDVIWWRIDTEFLKKILLLEDPKNYIIVNFLLDNRETLNRLTYRYSLSSRDSVYYSLLRSAEAGIRIGPNQAELPLFITYETLAKFSNTSKGYTVHILTELRQQGVLQSSKKPWVIMDLALLKSMFHTPDDKHNV